MGNETAITSMAQWITQLQSFVDAHKDDRPLPDGHMLSQRKDWQRRITGGALLSFLEFAADKAHDMYPKLGQNPITERAFVFITDVPGAIAARELIDISGNQAICVDHHIWRQFLESPNHDQDDTFVWHYECWSVWHRQVDPGWQFDRTNTHQLWVNEEGFALDDGLGRGSQHVWDWDGQGMVLKQQDISRWVEDARFVPEKKHHH